MSAEEDPPVAADCSEVNVLCLLRVGQEEHLDALRNGILYCRRLSFYSEIEGEPLAHQDGNEGLAAIFQSEQVEVVFTPHGHDPIVLNAAGGLTKQVLISRRFESPVFCLHAIHTGEWTWDFDASELDAFLAALQLPASMNKFGSHVWVIMNPTEFFRRVREACARQLISIYRGRVRYVNRELTHGAMPANAVGFVKLDDFEDEREYRLMFVSQAELPDPLLLDVGDLHDISCVVPIEDFRKGWTVRFPDTEDQEFHLPVPE